jgi:hypothetical protein
MNNFLILVGAYEAGEEDSWAFILGNLFICSFSGVS